MVSTFNPSELRGFFQTIDVGREGAVWVFHPSGLILFREPSTVSQLGASARDNAIFVAAARHEVGWIEGPAEPGGTVLGTAYRALHTPPLIVAVSLSTGELLRVWRRELVGSALVFAALAVIAAVTLNVLKRQMRARAAAEEALARVQQLESLGRLTGGIAHDFNNLLTAIVGDTQLALVKQSGGRSGSTAKSGWERPSRCTCPGRRSLRLHEHPSRAAR